MALPRGNRLNVSVRFVLFVTSYSPLFLLIIINQLSKSPKDLLFSGFKFDSIALFIRFYGISIFLLALMIIGFIGLYVFMTSVGEDVTSSGTGIVIRDFDNKNSESIGYIGTYIIPFLFNDYTTFYSLVSLVVLLLVVYLIYIQSSLIVVNPVLSVICSLYEIRFVDASGVSKRGMLITKEKYLSENDKLNVVPIGHKLYYGKNGGG